MARILPHLGNVFDSKIFKTVESDPQQKYVLKVTEPPYTFLP
jgi:hypothetical protein